MLTLKPVMDMDRKGLLGKNLLVGYSTVFWKFINKLAAWRKRPLLSHSEAFLTSEGQL